MGRSAAASQLGAQLPIERLLDNPACRRITDEAAGLQVTAAALPRPSCRMRGAHAGSAAEAGRVQRPLTREPGMRGWALAQPALPAGAKAPPAAPAGRHMSCARSAWRWGWAHRNAVSNKAASYPGQTSTHAPCAQLVARLASQRGARAGSGPEWPGAHTGSLRPGGLERCAEARVGGAAGPALSLVDAIMRAWAPGRSSSVASRSARSPAWKAWVGGDRPVQVHSHYPDAILWLAGPRQCGPQPCLSGLPCSCGVRLRGM